MSHYVITGGAGFIGSNLADYYLSRQKRVTIIDNFSRPGSEKNLLWLKARYRKRLKVIAAVALRLRQRLEAWDDRTERLWPAALGDEPLGGPNDVERVRLARFRRLAPGRDPRALPGSRRSRRGGPGGSMQCRAPAGSRAGATGTPATRSPKQSRVSASPSAAVASAIPESGWR